MTLSTLNSLFLLRSELEQERVRYLQCTSNVFFPTFRPFRQKNPLTYVINFNKETSHLIRGRTFQKQRSEMTNRKEDSFHEVYERRYIFRKLIINLHFRRIPPDHWFDDIEEFF